MHKDGCSAHGNVERRYMHILTDAVLHNATTQGLTQTGETSNIDQPSIPAGFFAQGCSPL